jgi:hypothetical protein
MRERRRAIFLFLVGLAATAACMVLARAAFAQPVGVEGIEEAMTDAVDSGKTIAKVVVGFIGAVILAAGLLTGSYNISSGRPQGFWQIAGVLGGAALIAVALKVIN